MSQYFNSIARQAGVRFGDQKGRPEPPAAQPLKTALRREPLEKDEVVMVPSNRIATGQKAVPPAPEPRTEVIDTKPGRKKRIRKLDEENIPVTRPPVEEEV